MYSIIFHPYLTEGPVETASELAGSHDLSFVLFILQYSIQYACEVIINLCALNFCTILPDEILSSIPNHLEGYEVDDSEDLFLSSSRCGVYRELEEKLDAEILMDNF
jgi:hypothetical protein